MHASRNFETATLWSSPRRTSGLPTGSHREKPRCSHLIFLRHHCRVGLLPERLLVEGLATLEHLQHGDGSIGKTKILYWSILLNSIVGPLHNPPNRWWSMAPEKG